VGENRYDDIVETSIGCPVLKVKIHNNICDAIIDTGSCETCISNAMYERLRQEDDVQVLPVANLRVYNPIGNKYVQIKKQIYVEIEIDQLRIDTVFLVVPQLTVDILIGSKWLAQNKCMIDYKNLRIEIRGAVVCASRVAFELTSLPKQDLNKFQDRTKMNIIMTHDNNIGNIRYNNSMIGAKENNNLYR